MEKDGIVLITCEELRDHLENNEAAVIIDTRHPMFYSIKHLPGAVNIFYDPNADPSDRAMMLAALPGDRLVVIYCS